MWLGPKLRLNCMDGIVFSEVNNIFIAFCHYVFNCKVKAAARRLYTERVLHYLVIRLGQTSINI